MGAKCPSRRPPAYRALSGASRSWARLPRRSRTGGSPARTWTTSRPQAGVTRVIFYRQLDSKADLYQSVLDRMCARLEAHVAEPVGGFTDDSVDGLLAAAIESPAGFRLLFIHALREPEFKERIEKFRSDIVEAAYLQISAFVPDRALARWAAEPTPAVAIEAIIAWLDAGQPEPEPRAAARVRRAVMGVVEAADVHPTSTASLPATLPDRCPDT